MISKKIGIVEKIKSENPAIQDIFVNIDGSTERAYNYIGLTGRAKIGDKVALNTTAVELSLGTGGFHFVIFNMDNPESTFTEGGHIMKLRYTPMQIKVDSVEEQGSKYHDVFNDFVCLEKMPVAVGTLHSILPPFAATFKKHCPDKKLVYIMTDGAALPLAFSKNVENLKEKGLIDATITYGNAFGGDYECVNIYTALITAKAICKADCVIVAMGPGIAGTGTKYGFSGINQGMIIDAVEKLGGESFVIPRISFADLRPRHIGISHHSITILSEITNKSTNLVINAGYDESKLRIIKDQILCSSIGEKHKVSFKNYEHTKEDLEEFDLKVKSMGRNFEEDREFFVAASTVASEISKELND
ncbi:DUF3866 family protein [Peptostreptococcus russellii]|uniref:DUF3866 domain-containing protein n=1 Tax=Peptostreptococcus russellii TaxID=215200 RepID=A0A1H8ECD0_9FIRM|nr:DUF3866 family protein [Peptostreptococcus russellii]SEN17231.1 Protein of unknown function [Peptostreptococcus russellii]